MFLGLGAHSRFDFYSPIKLINPKKTLSIKSPRSRAKKSECRWLSLAEGALVGGAAAFASLPFDCRPPGVGDARSEGGRVGGASVWPRNLRNLARIGGRGGKLDAEAYQSFDETRWLGVWF